MLCKLVSCRHRVGELHLVLVHDGGDGRLDERGAETRQYRGDASQNLVVEDGALREVGDLSRAADVGRRRQKRVLKDRPQQGVGAQPLGRLFENGKQVFGAVDVTAGPPLSIGWPAQSDTLAGLLVYEEEEGCAFRHHHLCVIALADQLLAASHQRLLQLIGMFDCIAQRGRAQRMTLPRCRIDHDQSLLGKDLRHQPRKRVRQRRLMPVVRQVTLPQPVRHRSIAQKLARPLQHRLDLRPRNHATHRHGMRNPQSGLQRLDRGLGQQRNLVHLGQVMILGRQPEDRHMLDAGRARRLLGPRHRRSRLQQRQTAVRQTAPPAGP